MKIKINIENDSGEVFSGEVELKKVRDVKVKKSVKNDVVEAEWYKPESTVARILDLASKQFFTKNKTIKDIIEKFETMDYHYKPSDLTLPLRKIVRKNILQREKIQVGNKKVWAYRNWE